MHLSIICSQWLGLGVHSANKPGQLGRTILPAMCVVRIVALIITTVAATLHGAVDHAPSAFTKTESVMGAVTLVRSSLACACASSVSNPKSACNGSVHSQADTHRQHSRAKLTSGPSQAHARVFCRYREHGRQGKAQVLSQQATLTAT